MVKVRYKFNDLNSIGYCQQQFNDKENKSFFELATIKDRIEYQLKPSNLAIFIKNRHPFDRWNKDCDTYNFTALNDFEDASFYIKKTTVNYGITSASKKTIQRP
ncbi:MAG: SAP53-like protein [Candidatus Phytoplasma pruni]|uniref:hypothetical protein n=1 Tax=Poinsettia branch-inducing phytoplasma TaxID=138647 RepID=UPI0004BC7F63|nr:hypothetical protein [Poinsettia branch-inducing phytoplasma]WEK82545.1 MAG: SAP53-like protein [Candidatus Phytoplasma pruni]